MNQKLLYVQVVDMEEEDRKFVEKEILDAFQKYSREDVIASKIREALDKQFMPSWNVIIGKNFGSRVVNQTKCYMFATYNNDEMAILIWKSWAYGEKVATYLAMIRALVVLSQSQWCHL